MPGTDATNGAGAMRRPGKIPGGAPSGGGMGWRTGSIENLKILGAKVSMGPTQQDSIEPVGPAADKARKSDPTHRPLWLVAIIFGAFSVVSLGIVMIRTGNTAEEMWQMVVDVALLRRVVYAGLDPYAGVVTVLLAHVPIIVLDFTLCRGLFPRDPGACWYLLHSLGNFVITGLSIPDFIYVFRTPPAALCVAYCRSLPGLGCSDWPTCIVVALHFYHMLAFRLSADDVFHHLLFVPIIAGMKFFYALGALCNVLCFFISGFPGAIDYMLLAAVKAGRVSPITEKRLNCSINTWLRGPGITTFCALYVACWMHPHELTAPDETMPWYFFVPVIFIIFFNGQYYAQRVIGNYYIRKAQDYHKRGIYTVDLHAS